MAQVYVRSLSMAQTLTVGWIDIYSKLVRKPLPKANPIDEVVGRDQPESPGPSRRSSALFAMDPVSRSDLWNEIPVGSYATKIKVKKDRAKEHKVGRLNG